jgi:hypothetical protein
MWQNYMEEILNNKKLSIWQKKKKNLIYLLTKILIKFN